MIVLVALAVGVLAAAVVAVLIDERPNWWYGVVVDFNEPEETHPLFGDPHEAAQNGRRVLTAFAVTILVFIVIRPLIGIAATVPSMLAGAIPMQLARRQRQQLARQRLGAWPDAVREIVASLLAARSLHQSLLALSTSGPELLHPVWRRYAQLSITLDQRAALESLRHDLADPVSDRVFEVLIMATEAGPGVMLDLLSDLAMSTSDDLELANRIETANLEQRLTGKIVLVLPMILLGMLVVASAEFASFYRSGSGLVVVFFGTCLGLAGMTAINRLARVPAEPRVFAVPGEDLTTDRAAEVGS